VKQKPTLPNCCSQPTLKWGKSIRAPPVHPETTQLQKVQKTEAGCTKHKASVIAAHHTHTQFSFLSHKHFFFWHCKMTVFHVILHLPHSPCAGTKFVTIKTGMDAYSAPAACRCLVYSMPTSIQRVEQLGSLKGFTCIWTGLTNTVSRSVYICKQV